MLTCRCRGSIFPRTSGVAAASAALAWTVSYVGCVVCGLRPQRELVAKALEATAVHLETPSGLWTRHRATVAVDRAWNSLAEVGKRHRRSPEPFDLVRVVETCEAVLIDVGETDPAADDLRYSAESVRRGESLRMASFRRCRSRGGGLFGPSASRLSGPVSTRAPGCCRMPRGSTFRGCGPRWWSCTRPMTSRRGR